MLCKTFLSFCKFITLIIQLAQSDVKGYKHYQNHVCHVIIFERNENLKEFRIHRGSNHHFKHVLMYLPLLIDASSHK